MSLYWQLRAATGRGGLHEIARVNGDVKEPEVRAVAQKLADQLGRKVEVRKVNDAVPMRAPKQHAALRRNPKSRARRGKQSNPARGADAAQAKRTFRKWHGFDPKKGFIAVKGTRTVPTRLVKLGEMPEIVYRSDKWTGKPQTYLHKFSKPAPLLCTDPAGKRLFIVGGGYRVTARGLVD